MKRLINIIDYEIKYYIINYTLQTFMKYLLLITGNILSTASLAQTSTFMISSNVGSDMKSALCFSMTISTTAGIPNLGNQEEQKLTRYEKIIELSL